MSNWRLVEGLESLILDDKVYLYPISKNKTISKHKTEILKTINLEDEDSMVYKNIEVNQFSLKFDEFFQAYIKGPEFPDPEKYYFIVNFFEGSAGKIITQTKCDNGTFNESFEAAFNEDYPGKVMLVSESMNDYDACMDETIRIVNCEIGKRTRKWIPGHRYDSPTETLYYLGEFKSHRSNELMSEYLGDDEMSSVHLVVDNVKGLSKISDVFKTKKFGDLLNVNNNIRVLDKIPLMVDSGEQLEDDVKNMDLSSMWNEMLTLALRDEKSSVKQVLDVLCYDNKVNPDSYKNISPDLIVDIENKIEGVIKKCLLIYLDTEVPITGPLGSNNNAGVINTTNPIKSNVDTILGCISGENYFNDLNAYAPLYYPELLKRIGINLKSLIEDIFKTYSPNKEVFDSIENYVKYGDLYFTYRDITKTEIVIDQVNRRLELKNYFDLILSNEIKDLVEQAKTNPFKITKFCKVKKSGSTTKIQRAIVTLNDILRNREFNLPENLKNEILKNKFRKVTIEFDLNNAIK